MKMQQVNRSLLTYYIGRIVPAAVNLAIVFVAYRLLGANEYGKYALVFYAVSLLHTLTYGWVQQSILRFLTGFDNWRQLIEKRFVLYNLLGALVMFVGAMCVGWFYFHLSLLATLLIGVFGFCYNFYMLRLTLFQASHQPRQYVLVEGLYSLLNFGFFLLIVAVFKIRQDFLTLFIAGVLALIPALIAGYRKMLIPSSMLRITRGVWRSSFLRSVFQYGFYLTLWLFLSYLLNVTDRYMIQYYYGYADAGTYSAVYDIVFRMATFSCFPVLLTLHPRITENFNKCNLQSARKDIEKGLKLEVGLALIVTVLLYLFRPLIFGKLLKLPADQVIWMALILLLGAFLWQISMLLHKPLELFLRQRTMLAGIVLSLVINILLNIWWLPKWGYEAAAYTTLISIVFYALFAGFMGRRVRI